MHSNSLTGVSFEPASCFLAMMSWRALRSVSKHPGRECYFTVCRAAATFMVYAGNVELPRRACQPSDRYVIQARKSPFLLMSFTDLSSVSKHLDRERCWTLCRAAATFMVYAGNIASSVPAYQ